MFLCFFLDIQGMRNKGKNKSNTNLRGNEMVNLLKNHGLKLFGLAVGSFVVYSIAMLLLNALSFAHKVVS